MAIVDNQFEKNEIRIIAMEAIINSEKIKMAQQVSCLHNTYFKILGVLVGGDTGCVGSALVKNKSTERFYAMATGVLTSLPSDITIINK
jgi:hypothetical protein